MAEPKRRNLRDVYEGLKKISQEDNVDFGIDNYTYDQFKQKYGTKTNLSILHKNLSQISDETGLDFGIGTTDEWLNSFTYDGTSSVVDSAAPTAAPKQPVKPMGAAATLPSWKTSAMPDDVRKRFEQQEAQPQQQPQQPTAHPQSTTYNHATFAPMQRSWKESAMPEDVRQRFERQEKQQRAAAQQKPQPTQEQAQPQAKQPTQSTGNPYSIATPNTPVYQPSAETEKAIEDERKWRSMLDKTFDASDPNNDVAKNIWKNRNRDQELDIEALAGTTWDAMSVEQRNGIVNSIVESIKRQNPLGPNQRYDEAKIRANAEEIAKNYSTYRAANYMSRIKPSVEEAIAATKKQGQDLAQRVKTALDKRGMELDQAAIDNPIGDRPRGGGALVSTFNANTVNGRFADTEWKELYAANNALDHANKLFREAETSKKRGHGNFAATTSRGIANKLGDPRLWDMGISRGAEADALNTALMKADKGDKLTEAEEMLLDAKAIEMAAQMYTESDISGWFTAGEVTAEMLPFMLEMMINPAARVGKSAQSMLTRYALKRFGKQALKKGGEEVWKGRLMRFGGRALGDVAGSVYMGMTTSAPRVGANATERLNGDIMTSTDQEGKTHYAGHKVDEDMTPWKALLEGFGSEAIEDHSEMLGEYFTPMFKVMGKYGSKLAQSNFGKVFRLNRVDDFLTRVGTSDFIKMVDNFLDQTKWDGVLEEYAEEVVGGVENAIIVGDQTLDTDPDTGVFNLKNNLETLRSVGLFGGAVAAVKTLGYRTPKYKARKEVTMADTMAQSRFANGEWQQIRQLINDNMYSDNLPEELAKRMQTMSAAQKRAVIDYYSASFKYNGMLRADEKRKGEGFKSQLEKAYEQSYEQAESPEAKADVSERLNEAQRRLDGLVDQQTLQMLDSEEYGADVYNSLPDNAKAAYNEYRQAQAAMDGVQQRISDDADMMAAEQREEAKKKQFRGEGENNGALRPMKINVTGVGVRDVYLTQGEIALTESGLVDPEKTKELNNVGTLTGYDPATGEEVQFTPADIVEVEPMTTAEQQEQNIEANKQAYIQQQMDAATPTATTTDPKATTSATTSDNQQQEPAPAKPKGEPKEFVPGMTLTVTDRDGNEHSVTTDGKRYNYNPVTGELTESENGNYLKLTDKNGDVLSYDLSNRGLGSAQEIKDYEMPKEEQPTETVEPTEQPTAEVPTAESITPQQQVTPESTHEPAPVDEVDPMQAPMPMRTVTTGKGKNAKTETVPDFYAVPEEKTFDYIYNELGFTPEIADATVKANADETAKTINEHKAKEPQPMANPIAYKEAHDAWQRDIDAMNQQADYWKKVQSIRNQQLLAEAEERDKATRAERERRQKEIEASRKRDEEAYQAELSRRKAERDKKMEASINNMIQMSESEEGKMMEQMAKEFPIEQDAEAMEIMNDRSPRTLEEVAAWMLSDTKDTKNKIDPELVREHTGYGTADFKKFPFIFKKGGMSPEAFGEKIEQIARENDVVFDENDTNAGFNALLNMLGEVGGLGDIKNYIKNNRIAEAEKLHSDRLREAVARKVEDDWIAQHGGMSREEYASYINWMEDAVEQRKTALTDEEYNQLFNTDHDTRTATTDEGSIERGAEKSVADEPEAGQTGVAADDTRRDGEEAAEPAIKQPAGGIDNIIDELVAADEKERAAVGKPEYNEAYNEKSALADRVLQAASSLSQEDLLKIQKVATERGMHTVAAHVENELLRRREQPKTSKPAGEVAESREERDKRLEEERKQRILSEGTSFDKPFALTPVSETMTPEEIGANVRRIVEGLKQNEGNGTLDTFEGFAYNKNFKKNAGHQVDEYLVSLTGVVPDETLRQWYESEGLKTRDDLRAFGEKLYAEQPESKTEVKAPNNDEVKGQEATEEPKKTELKVTFGFDTNSSLGRDILPLIKKWQDTFINIMHRRRGYAKQNNKFKSLGEKNGWERYRDADLYAVFDSNGNLIDFADSPRGAYDIALNSDVESFYVVRQQPTEDGYQYNGTTGWLFTNDIPESEWRDNQGKLREEVKAAATRSIEEALPTVMQPKQQKTGGEATKTSKRDRGLLEVVMDKLRNIIGDRLHTTLTEDEKRLINWARTAYLRVFHGSGADFERFDSSHMGEGEGAQAYGYGHYTTEVEGIGRTYAKKIGGNNTNIHGIISKVINNHRNLTDAEKKVLENIRLNSPHYPQIEDIKRVRSKYEAEKIPLEEQLKALPGDIDKLNEIIEFVKGVSDEEWNNYRLNKNGKIADFRKDYEEWILNNYPTETFTEKTKEQALKTAELDKEHLSSLLNAYQKSINEINEKIAAFDWISNELNNYLKEGPTLYTVEIPDDNGSNYLEWDKPVTAEQQGIIYKYLRDNNITLPDATQKFWSGKSDDWSTGEKLYDFLLYELQSEKAASEFLHNAGFTGIKYPAQYRSGGREDNAKNYVIFDDGDLKITDKIKFFKTPQGEVYGFTVGGNIYVDMDIAKADTPIHEYGHLWVPMVRESDPEMWEDIKSVLTKDKDVKPFMDIVRQRYPELTAEGREDDFMEEVFTHFSGDNGLKMLEEAAREYEEQDGQGFISKAKAIAALNKVKEALDKFWGKVAQLFGIKFRNAREVANKMFKDFMDEVDPTKVRTERIKNEGLKPEEEKTLMGVHNISEEKLRKALKNGGFANPSMAVIDTKNGGFDSYGDISLIPRSSLIDARTGRNAGTYSGDAYTPIYPNVEYYEGKETEKKLQELTSSLPQSIGEYIRRKVSNYMDRNSNNSGLEYLFLKEHGVDMPIVHNERRYPGISTKQIAERMGVSEYLYGSDLYNEYKKMPEDQRFDFNLWLQHYGNEEDIAKVKNLIAEMQEKGKEKEANYLIDHYTKPMNFAHFDSTVYNISRDEREAGEENLARTVEDAAMEVNKQDLRNEFDAWQQKVIDGLGYEEKLFAGYTPSGYRKYLPNTAENASKLMNKQEDTNAGNDTGLNATRSALLYKMQSLDDIRQHRDLLQGNDAYGERQSEMTDELLDLAHQLSDMQKIDDNPFINTDYAILRMQDAFTKKDPIGYLNKEYGYSIDKDSEFAKQMLDFMNEVRDLPAKYFETKFKRPVALDEFAVAVVPEGTSQDVVDALKNAGLDVRTYDGTSENRQAVTLEAVRGRDDIMFQKADNNLLSRDNANVSFENHIISVDEMRKRFDTPITMRNFTYQDRNAILGVIDWLREARIPEQVNYRDLHPTPTLDDYYIATKGEFTYVGPERKGTLNELEQENKEQWREMKDSGKYEWHQSPLSFSEYLVDRSNGDIYRLSNHWGRVASCHWDCDKVFGYTPIYQIGKINIKDLSPKPHYTYEVINPAYEAAYVDAVKVARKNVDTFLAEVDVTDKVKRDIEEEIRKKERIAEKIESAQMLNRFGNTVLFRSLDPESDEVVDNAEVGTKPLSDREKVAKLEAEPKVKVYRSMQLIDGKLYPPMSAKVDGQLREPSELGVWEEADEAPDMADENGKFKLDKGNRKSLKAAYNPYIHTSRTMLNDQFSEAQDRPNLVVVEMEVPESELTSGYKAEKAKDSVGAKQWKAGVIQGQLSGTREVILSRWAKPVRIVPTEEVADNIAKQIEGQVAVMPSNVVTPEVRAALEARGVKFVETDNTGKIKEGPNKGKTWVSVYGKKEQAKRDAVERLGKRFGVDIEVVENPDDIQHSSPSEQEKMRKAPGFYRLGSGKVVIVLPNNRDVKDTVATVMHEVLTHKGLREVIGEDNMPAFLDEIYSHLTDELKKRVDTKMTQEFINDMRSIDHARRVATEEMIADISEKMPEEMTENERSLWQKVCDWIRNAIDKLFTELKLPKGYKVTENDIRYMIWKTRQHMEGRKPDYVEMAQDVNKRNELGLDEENLYRDQNNAVDDVPRAAAREAYERMMDSGANQFKEAVQDSMLSLKKLYEAILGKGTKIEDVEGYKNAYLAENRMHSASQAEIGMWHKDFMEPVVKAIHELTGGKRTAYDDLVKYMMAKHGLERNAVFAERDAQAAAKKGADYDDELQKNRGRDYAGLTALTGEDDVANAEGMAQKMVDDYEADHDTTELWNAINRATKQSLWKLASSGMMTPERYNEIRDMFSYYIPLQGFDETVAENVYSYMGNDGTIGYGTPIRHARGRKSLADDPIATMAMNGEAAIRQANRNEMKKRFLAFAQEHPSDLVSVSEVWLKHNDVTGEWEQVTADLNENDSPADVERKTREFDEKMEQLASNDPDHYKKASDIPNVPFRVVEPSDMKQHQVLVQRGGKKYMLTINGNPRAAQALNGLTNPDVFTEGVFGKAMNLGQWLNRQLSAFYTTRNPEFVLSNFLRDAIYSNSMSWVKESPNYALKFHKNFGKMNPVHMGKLFAQWENGKLRERIKNGTASETDQLFYDFMTNGGETGWTSLRDIEKHKKELQSSLKREGSTSRKAWKALGEAFDLMNRSVENCARFAAFVTSREMGRSIDRSISDAKEVSVNFNKKGAGDKFLTAKNQNLLGKVGASMGGLGRGLYVFFNASMQGLNNIARATKRHPGKAAGVYSTLFALGALAPILAEVLSGGDDDDDKNAYYNLPEYIRRSNICFRFGKDMPWITIPLPIEFRAIYGLGELSTGALTGKEHYTDEEFAKQYVSQLSQVLPLDFMEGGGGWHAFVPSMIKPYVEAQSNTSWTGLPIYRDNTFKPYDPEWTRAYSSANKQLVDATKWLNEATGGDDVTKGFIDWNPAKIEYMLKGYLGGYFTMYDRLQKTAETALGNRDFEWRNIPMASRVLREGDERTEARKLTNEYFDLVDEYNDTKHKVKEYEKISKSDREDAIKYAQKLAYLNNSEEYTRYLLMEYYKPILDQFHDMVKEADGEQSKRIKGEENALRRELINIIHSIDDGAEIDVDAAIDEMLMGILNDEQSDISLRKKAQNTIKKHRKAMAASQQ